MKTQNFWPLDYDPEGEIYENVAWDLPGYTLRRQKHCARRRETARVGERREKLR